MTKIIIWDEATILNKKIIETLDILLQDNNECKLPFGGKVVVSNLMFLKT